MNPASSRSPTDLAVIFDGISDCVWATLRRLGVPETDREDLVHDVFEPIPPTDPGLGGPLREAEPLRPRCPCAPARG